METPDRKLAFEMIKTAARIVRAAKEMGYLNDELRTTGKPIKFIGNGSADGFGTSYLIYGYADIRQEVAFLTSGRAVALAESVGMDSERVERILGMLRRYRPRR